MVVACKSPSSHEGLGPTFPSRYLLLYWSSWATINNAFILNMSIMPDRLQNYHQLLYLIRITESIVYRYTHGLHHTCFQLPLDVQNLPKFFSFDFALHTCYVDQFQHVFGL